MRRKGEAMSAVAWRRWANDLLLALEHDPGQLSDVAAAGLLAEWASDARERFDLAESLMLSRARYAEELRRNGGVAHADDFSRVKL